MFPIALRLSLFIALTENKLLPFYWLDGKSKLGIKMESNSSLPISDVVYLFKRNTC